MKDEIMSKEKTVREWLETLPEPYRTQAISQSKYIDTFACSLIGAIERFTDWRKTNEGTDYWLKVSDDLKNGKIKPVFIGNKTGWYRLRNGGIALINNFEKESIYSVRGFIADAKETIKLQQDSWDQYGAYYEDKKDYPYDLIEYIGPIEIPESIKDVIDGPGTYECDENNEKCVVLDRHKNVNSCWFVYIPGEDNIYLFRDSGCNDRVPIIKKISKKIELT